MDFADNGELLVVWDKVQDTIAHDAVHRVVGQGQHIDVGMYKLDVGDAELQAVLLGEVDHVLGQREGISIIIGAMRHGVVPWSRRGQLPYQWVRPVCLRESSRNHLHSPSRQRNRPGMID